jgi:hypothetical protein
VSLLRPLALAALLLAAPAFAQLDHPLAQGTPLERATEAFDTEYGQLLVRTFARILRESADPACVAERRILAHRWEDEAHQILVRRGGQMLHAFAKAVDRQRFDALLATLVGPGATAEILQLRQHPDVKPLLALARTAKMARTADHITEIVDRYALLNRIRLKARVSPPGSGDLALLNASPEEKAGEAIDALLAKPKSPELARYLVLEEALARVVHDAQRTEEMLKLGPSQMMAGLDEDLAALCITKSPGRGPR